MRNWVVPSDTVENLCGDFVDNFGASGGILGSYENTVSLLLNALPKDRVAQIMEEIAALPDAPCGIS